MSLPHDNVSCTVANCFICQQGEAAPIPPSALKPCPFCGGKPGTHENLNYQVEVGCSECGVATEFYDQRADAIEAWNRRSGAASFSESAIAAELGRHDDWRSTVDGSFSGLTCGGCGWMIASDDEAAAYAAYDAHVASSLVALMNQKGV